MTSSAWSISCWGRRLWLPASTANASACSDSRVVAIQRRSDRRQSGLGQRYAALQGRQDPCLRANSCKGISGSRDARSADQGRRHRRPAQRVLHRQQFRRGQDSGSALGVGIRRRRRSAAQRRYSWTRTCPQNTNITSLRTPDTSLSSRPARRHWWRNCRGSAPTREASTALPSTGNSTPMCSRSFEHT